MPVSYIIIPAVTAFIGWATNVIAVRMLFRPRRPLRLGFWRLQGVIPKRQTALAASIADLFEQELLSKEELASQMDKVALEGEISGLLEERMGRFLDGLSTKVPMLQMFLNDSMKQVVVGQLNEQMQEAMPEIKQRVGNSLSESVDLRAVVEDKVVNFSLPKLESIILRVASRELKAVEWFGGLLGLLIGLAQVGLMAYFS